VSRSSRKYWSLDVSQPHGLPQPVRGITLPFHKIYFVTGMYKGFIVYGQNTTHVILFSVKLSHSAWKVNYEYIKYIQNINFTDLKLQKLISAY
jgi:hypothetical protein